MYRVVAYTIQVNEQLYQTKAFIIVAGSNPAYDQARKENFDKRLITSDQIFELENLPQSLAVIGIGSLQSS